MRDFDIIDDTMSNGFNRASDDKMCVCWIEDTNTIGQSIQRFVTLSGKELSNLKTLVNIWGVTSGILEHKERTTDVKFELL